MNHTSASWFQMFFEWGGEVAVMNLSVAFSLRSAQPGALAPCAQRMAPEPLTKLELHGGQVRLWYLPDMLCTLWPQPSRLSTLVQARAFSALLSCSARQHLKVLDVRLQGAALSRAKLCC